MISPLSAAQMQGPQITPKTTPGGGAALPPYLQMRQPTTQTGGTAAPTYSAQQTQPVVTPKPTAVQGEVKPQQAPQAPSQGLQQPAPPQAQPQITPYQSATNQYNAATNIGSQVPSSPAGQPAQAGGQTLGDVYKFFQSDLANQAKQATANSVSDASARGVYYGTPLTGSEADINTQYLRGLGQLQAGMYGNEQQNQLARLGLAESLGWQNAFNQPQTPGPMDFSGLGALFANNPQTAQTQQPTITPRQGPVGQPGNYTQSGPGSGYRFQGFGY